MKLGSEYGPLAQKFEKYVCIWTFRIIYFIGIAAVFALVAQ
jgi:hypothetical protein